jgi:hypothetical protein
MKPIDMGDERQTGVDMSGFRTDPIYVPQVCP